MTLYLRLYWEFFKTGLFAIGGGMEPLPFLKDLAMHDWWIGLNAELKGKVEFIYEPLIKHRCHGGNVTGGRTTAAQKLSWRIHMVGDILRFKYAD